MSMNTQKQSLKSTFSKENDEFTELSTTALLARKSVPALHRELANNYILIKRIYKFQAIKSSLSEQDKILLNKYSFAPLAETTISKVNSELELMRSLSSNENEQIRLEADELIKIRTKELKYITASSYSRYDNELNNGYTALERYFEEISKYYS